MKAWKDNSHPIEYQGIQYPSYSALGRAFGRAPTAVKRRLARQQPLEYRHVREHNAWNFVQGAS